MGQMELGMWQEREEGKRAAQENEALLARVAALTHELDGSRRERDGLRGQLAASHARVGALGAQLSESLAAQQRLLARRRHHKQVQGAAASTATAAGGVGPAMAAGAAAADVAGTAESEV